MKYWLFLDEYGDTKFTPANSKHFALACVATSDPVGLLAATDALRHQWLKSGHLQQGYFHARDNCWPVRNALGGCLSALPIARIDAVALKKASAYPSVQNPKGAYQAVLKVLLRYCVPRLVGATELTVVAAEWSPYKPLDALATEVLTRPSYRHPVLWNNPLHCAVIPSSAHGALQIADYAAWGLQRGLSKGQWQTWQSTATAVSAVSRFEIG